MDGKLARSRVSSGSPYESRIGFSRGVRVGRVVSIAGTAPIGPEGENVAPGDPSAQARRCLEIIRESLDRLGASLADVHRTRVYLVRAGDWEAVGRVHGEFFGEVRPACTFVEVRRLIDAEWLVEIEADAVVSEPGR